MRIILFKVGPRNMLFAPLVTVMTFFLAHFCCIASTLLIPLGLGGVTTLAGESKIPWQQGILVVGTILLLLRGRSIYRSPDAPLAEKIILWVSFLLIFYMGFNTI